MQLCFIFFGLMQQGYVFLNRENKVLSSSSFVIDISSSTQFWTEM